MVTPRVSSHDPYRTFKFRVRLGEKTILGVTKVSGLSRSVTATEVREGGDNLGAYQNPGLVSFSDVQLEFGMTDDEVLEKWANAAAEVHADPSIRDFKRSVFIDVFDLRSDIAAGQSTPVASYKLHRAWVTNFQALPDLDAMASGVAIRSVTLKHEGWERVA